MKLPAFVDSEKFVRTLAISVVGIYFVNFGLYLKLPQAIWTLIFALQLVAFSAMAISMSASRAATMSMAAFLGIFYAILLAKGFGYAKTQLYFPIAFGAAIFLRHIVGSRLSRRLQTLLVFAPFAVWIWATFHAWIAAAIALAALMVLPITAAPSLRKVASVDTEELPGGRRITVTPLAATVSGLGARFGAVLAYLAVIIFFVGGFDRDFWHGISVFTVLFFSFGSFALLWVADRMLKDKVPSVIEVRGRAITVWRKGNKAVAEWRQNSRLDVVAPQIRGQAAPSSTTTIADMGEGPGGAAMLGASVGLALLDAAGRAPKIFFNQTAALDAKADYRLVFTDGAQTVVLVTGVGPDLCQRAAQAIAEAISLPAPAAA